MSTRYMAKTLQTDIDDINDWFADAGSLLRLEYGHRNGYCAVDEYPVDINGARIGSGVNHNVECGSPRQCYDAAILHYYIEANRLLRFQLTAASAT